MTTTPEFFCRPVRAETLNDDGTPSTITECSLDESSWIAIYRRGPEPDDVNWICDLAAQECDRPEQLRVAQGLCDLLNGITPQEAVNNPKLHIFFE